MREVGKRPEVQKWKWKWGEVKLMVAEWGGGRQREERRGRGHISYDLKIAISPFSTRLVVYTI